MSEVQSRPAPSRGRGSGRGGRGGFASRGRGPRPTNGDSKHENDSSQISAEDEGDIGELKRKYGAKAALLKGPFPDWSEVDILYALQENDGDEGLAATRMSEGMFRYYKIHSAPVIQLQKSFRLYLLHYLGVCVIGVHCRGCFNDAHNAE
jgi:hypothetical protein